MYQPPQMATFADFVRAKKRATLLPVSGTAEGVATGAGVTGSLAAPFVMGGHAGPLVSDTQPNGTMKPGTQVPIGYSGDLNNKFADKFRRGWLDGAGGADIEMALGSTAFDVRPAPYNSREMSKWLSAGPAAQVPGLANWDVNAPDRSWNPLGLASAEWIPTTYSNRMAGLNVITGVVGAREATARNDIFASPTPQFYAWNQMREGGDAAPSVPFGASSAGGAAGGGRGKKKGRFAKIGS